MAEAGVTSLAHPSSRDPCPSWCCWHHLTSMAAVVLGLSHVHLPSQ